MLSVGDIIYVDELDTYGIVTFLKHNSIEFYGKDGHSLALLSEAYLSDKTMDDILFHFWRLYLPYGKWVCEDGTEVLFNRDYCPMWARNPSGEIVGIEPDLWVIFKEQTWFTDESGRYQKQKGENILKEWGLAGEKPASLNRIFEAKRLNDFNILKQKSCDKKFLGLKAN